MVGPKSTSQNRREREAHKGSREDRKKERSTDGKKKGKKG